MIYLIDAQTKEHRHWDTQLVGQNRWVAQTADINGWIKWHGDKCPLPAGHPYEAFIGDQLVHIHGDNPEHINWERVAKYRPVLNQPEPPKEWFRPKEDQAPEWDGEGLPPVGMMCEYRHDKEWVGAEVLAHRNYCAIVWTEDGAYFSCVSRKFRPIPTDREQWIEAASDHLGCAVNSLAASYLADLYDAMVRGDLPLPKTQGNA